MPRVMIEKMITAAELRDLPSGPRPGPVVGIEGGGGAGWLGGGGGTGSLEDCSVGSVGSGGGASVIVNLQRLGALPDDSPVFRTAWSLCARYGSSRNGGYASVRNRKYASTRVNHRSTPITKFRIPSFHRPVNSTMKKLITTMTHAAM